jgi:hypothetical protein
MSATQRAAAGAVAVLVVLGVAILVLGSIGAPIGRGAAGDADASASIPPSPIGASASARPSEEARSAPPMSEEEMLAALAEIETEVEAIRGLPAADIGPPEILTRDEVRVELEAMFAEDYPPEEREQDNLVLRALGLLTPEQDVAELQLQLIGDSVLGFYDDVDRRMVVVSDRGLDTEAKITYAHEYTHALQDAAFGLGSLDTEAVGEDDRSLARVTLIEGDATVTMLAWAFASLSPQELQDYALGAEIPDTAGIPQWMVDQLAFPYETGLMWTGALAGNPLAPTFAPIDDAFAEPPDSTEQVMDESLDAWVEREQPIPVAAPDVVEVLGEGWEEIEATTVGQGTIEIMLEYFGAAGGEAATAADGWGGDRAVVAYGPDDAFAVAWRLAWDTPTDATEFSASYEAATSDLPFTVRVGEPDGAEVLVIHASSDDLAGRLADALD